MAGLIGSIVGAAGSIYGGIKASQAMGRLRDNLLQQQKENQDWYDRRYNEDATQRADAQRLLQLTEDSIKRRNRAAAGTAAVMGGTNEAVAAEKAANAGTLASAASQIAAGAEARKDKIEQQFLANKQVLNDQMNALEQQKAENIGKAIAGVTGAVGDMDFGETTIGGKKIAL